MSSDVGYIKLIFYKWDIWDVSHIHTSYPNDIRTSYKKNQSHLPSNFFVFRLNYLFSLCFILLAQFN